jgi:hypothetical protein
MLSALRLLSVTLSILLLPGMHLTHAQNQTLRNNSTVALATLALPLGSTAKPPGVHTFSPQAQQGLAVIPARFEIQGVQAIRTGPASVI